MLLTSTSIASKRFTTSSMAALTTAADVTPKGNGSTFNGSESALSLAVTVLRVGELRAMMAMLEAPESAKERTIAKPTPAGGTSD
jgi:hypothetical protein